MPLFCPTVSDYRELIYLGDCTGALTSTVRSPPLVLYLVQVSKTRKCETLDTGALNDICWQNCAPVSTASHSQDIKSLN